MNRFSVSDPLSKSASRSRASKLALLAAGTTLLSGCLLESPYWNQQFAKHTQAIPLQAFTSKPDTQVKFECAQAFHGGLYPDASTATWITVANVMPSKALYDPKGGKTYGAGISKVLPSSCWRQDPGNSIWYSSIRATQANGTNTIKYMTFDKAGLACLAQKVAASTSWYADWGGCAKTYSGSTNKINYVIFRAVS
jgi:hypothetical protein